MSNPDWSSLRRRRAAVVLLVAALAYLAGVTTGALWHTHMPGAEAVAVAPAGSAPAAPTPDVLCAVCHALAAPALPVVAAAPPPAAIHAAESAAPTPCLASSSRIAASARGPPRV